MQYLSFLLLIFGVGCQYPPILAPSFRWNPVLMRFEAWWSFLIKCLIHLCCLNIMMGWARPRSTWTSFSSVSELVRFMFSPGGATIKNNVMRSTILTGLVLQSWRKRSNQSLYWCHQLKPLSIQVTITTHTSVLNQMYLFVLHVAPPGENIILSGSETLENEVYVERGRAQPITISAQTA